MFPRLTERIVLALVLLAPWSLLWLDAGLLFPYTTGKAWVFRSLVELGFAFSLLTLLGDRLVYGQARTIHQPAARGLLWIMLAFLAWSGLANLAGIDPYRSFWSNWERMSGYLDYLHWAMYLVCLLTVLNQARTRYLMLNLFSVIALVALLGLLDEGARAISTLGNPIYLGNLVVFGLFLGIFLLAPSSQGRALHWLLRLAILAAMVMMLLALGRAAARGPSLALAAGLLIVAMGMLVQQRSKPLRLLGWGLVPVLVIAGLLQLNGIRAVLGESDLVLLQRLGSISLHDQTTADRLENWSIALSAATSHPWLGWGQENYEIAFNEHYRAGVIDHARLWFDRAHNAYLDALVAGGIPGLLLYLMMLVLLLYLLARTQALGQMQKAAMAGLLTAFLTKNLVGFDTFSSTLVWLNCAAVILAGSRLPRNRAMPSESDIQRARFPVLLAALCLLPATILAVYTLNLQSYRDNQRFAALMNRPLASLSVPLLQVQSEPVESLRYAQTERLAVFDHLVQRLLAARPGSFEPADRERLAELAVELFDRALQYQPRDYRIRYNGAMLLARLGDIDGATRHLEVLLLAAPERTAVWHRLATLYAGNGRQYAAEHARQTAMNLNPHWSP